MSPENTKPSSSEEIDKLRSEVKSSLKLLVGFCIALGMVYEITLLFSISNDIYLMGRITVFFTYPATGILGLLILVYLTIFAGYFIKLRRQRNQNNETLEETI